MTDAGKTEAPTQITNPDSQTDSLPFNPQREERV